MARNDDIVVLTETTARPGTEFIAGGLREHGYQVVGAATMNGDRGAVLATRLRTRRAISSTFRVTLPWRVVAVELAELPILVIGVYVPSRDKSQLKIERKSAFIESLLDSLRRLPSSVRRRTLMAGDYNVIPRAHEPKLAGYFQYEYRMHDNLAELGLTSGHTLFGASPQPHSWIGRSGIGYLYDYIHFAAELVPKVRSCSYIHDTRQLQISDHAAVSATVAVM